MRTFTVEDKALRFMGRIFIGLATIASFLFLMRLCVDLVDTIWRLL